MDRLFVFDTTLRDGIYKVVAPVAGGKTTVSYTHVNPGKEQWATVGEAVVLDVASQAGILLKYRRQCSSKTGTDKIPVAQQRGYAFTLGMIAQCCDLHAYLKPGSGETNFRSEYQLETGTVADEQHTTALVNNNTWGNKLAVSAPYDKLEVHPKYFDITSISGTQMDDDHRVVCANVWAMNLISMGFRLGKQNGEQILNTMEHHGDPNVRDMANDFLEGYTEDISAIHDR